MSLHHFPLLAGTHTGPSVGIWQVRQILGRTDHSDKVFIAYVQALVEEVGFPRPFPSRIKGPKSRGGGLTLAVTRHSSFRRDAVEAWAADYLPPACAATLDAVALDQAAQDMDQAAAQLGRPLHLIEGGRA